MAFLGGEHWAELGGRRCGGGGDSGGGGAAAAEGGVPVVLDGVVGAPGEEARDGGPLVTVEGVGPEDDVVLHRREGAVLHGGAELVAPPQPARLPRPPRYPAAYSRPVPCPVLRHQLQQRRVLLRGPRPLDSISAVRFPFIADHGPRFPPVRENATKKEGKKKVGIYLHIYLLVICFRFIS